MIDKESSWEKRRRGKREIMKGGRGVNEREKGEEFMGEMSASQ
jgi:hypothetical protein